MKNIFPLNTVSPIPPKRYRSGIDGFDYLLGGGLVAGSAIILAGTPGAGKTSLLTQIAYQYASGERMIVLYVNGEENKEQIKMKAERFGIDSDKIILMEDTNIEHILDAQRELQPRLIIIDSLQMLYSQTLKQAPATPTQMKYALLTLTKLAKENDIIIIFVGHSTKGGFIAGLQTLQHMVDVTLYLGVDDTVPSHRFLKANKNRFGAIDFVWQVGMTQWGLVSNPSQTIPIQEQETSSTGLKTAQKTITLADFQIEDMVKDKLIWGLIIKTSLNFLRKQYHE